MTWSLLIPAHLDMARVDVTQPVSGVMADDAPGVARNSELWVVETRLHVTPLPHQSAVSHQIIIRAPDPGLPHVPLLPAVQTDAVTEDDPHWPRHAVNLLMSYVMAWQLLMRLGPPCS